jgi:hypothetical protein
MQMLRTQQILDTVSITDQIRPTAMDQDFRGAPWPRNSTGEAVGR